MDAASASDHDGSLDSRSGGLSRSNSTRSADSSLGRNGDLPTQLLRVLNSGKMLDEARRQRLPLRKRLLVSMVSRIGLILRYIDKKVTNENDTMRTRVQTVSYFFVIPVIGFCGLVWGSVLLGLGHSFSSIPPFVYFALAVFVTSLVAKRCIYAFTGSAIMLFFLLALPTALHAIMGGFTQSSAVLSWTVVAAPLAVVLLQSRGALALYFLLMLVFFGGATLFSELSDGAWLDLREQEALSGGTRLVFFVLDLIAPSIVLLGALFYYEVRLSREQRVTENLLTKILPKHIARRLKKGVARSQLSESHKDVAIFFADVVGFTALSARKTPAEMMAILDEIYTQMDNLADSCRVYKVETIGDAYLCVCGLPRFVPSQDSIERIVRFAVEVRDYIDEFGPQYGISMRIGIHIGDVVSGVLGVAAPRYNIVGDAVNTASRVESSGQPGRIHVSRSVFDCMRNDDRYFFTKRAPLAVKGKGVLQTYWLDDEKSRGKHALLSPHRLAAAATPISAMLSPRQGVRVRSRSNSASRPTPQVHGNASPAARPRRHRHEREKKEKSRRSAEKDAKKRRRGKGDGVVTMLNVQPPSGGAIDGFVAPDFAALPVEFDQGAGARRAGTRTNPQSPTSPIRHASASKGAGSDSHRSSVGDEGGRGSSSDDESASVEVVNTLRFIREEA